MTDLVLTSTQQNEIYTILHNFVAGTGRLTLDSYFVAGGTGATRIQQAVAQQFATVNAAIDLLIAAVTDTPTKADLAAAVTDIKAHIDQVCGPPA